MSFLDLGDKFAAIAEIVGGSKHEVDPVVPPSILRRGAKVAIGVVETLNVGLRDNDYELPPAPETPVEATAGEATVISIDAYRDTDPQMTELIDGGAEGQLASVTPLPRHAGGLVMLDARKDASVEAAQASVDDAFGVPKPVGETDARAA